VISPSPFAFLHRGSWTASLLRVYRERPTRHPARRKPAATPRRRHVDRESTTAPPTVRTRVAVIDTAAAATNDSDANDRSDRLTDPTKAAAARSTANCAAAHIRRRGGGAHRRRTRRRRNDGRRLHCWSWRLGRRLRLRDFHLVFNRRFRRLGNLALSCRCGTSNRFVNIALPDGRTRGRRLDGRDESRALIVAYVGRELHARCRGRGEIPFQIRRQGGILVGRLAAPAREMTT